ncbi:hypothetical protein NUW54_g9577 [Trametes sanguinea]|uniref:Uncharacterized protein n=1 Tax=Trametes sanguinea TaxID=158606 RepID=A0ACC1P7U4_9APHY|nr:hypothetical protein NUW54_g9577 [Trametes sanguinea]
MVSPLLQAVAVCSVTWFLWKFFRRFVVKTDLDNLPGPPSPSFIYGNIRQLYDRRSFKFHRHLGEEYGPVVRLHGRFGENVLYTYDPKAMHHIVIKDQEVFQESNWFTRMLLQLFGPGLLSTLGDHHRKQRKMLNPVFSINHMRHMTPIFYDVCHKLRTAVEARVRSGDAEVDMVGWMGRTALELMGQAGAGILVRPARRGAQGSIRRGAEEPHADLVRGSARLDHVEVEVRSNIRGFRRACVWVGGQVSGIHAQGTGLILVQVRKTRDVEGRRGGYCRHGSARAQRCQKKKTDHL